MKHFLAFTSLCVLLVGCTTQVAPLGQAFVKTAAFDGVSVGTFYHPETIPYIKTATIVVCASANSTNVVPEQIIANLEKAGVGTNQLARLIIMNAVNLYTAVYSYYGDSIANQPILLGYLHALCDGMNEGLPEPPTMARAMAVFNAKKKLPPHLR